VCIRRLESESPRVALRSADVARSIIDLLEMPAIPGQSTQQRFIARGDDRVAARRMLDHVAGLLPVDVSVLRTTRHLVIDFSSRPFDPVELSRMMSLADQLVTAT
jgi:hypothetical protein